jgi:hypothetical protein
MSDPSIETFDEGVTCFFRPLAERIKLPLQKLAKGVYEITGKTFVLRIREGIGHSRDFLLSVSKKDEASQSPRDLGKNEIGLGVVAEFGGEKLGPYKYHTREGYLHAFKDQARAAEKYGVPYLLDLRSNFEDIREFVERKVVESGIREKKFHFPPNVREEWIRPERPE